MVEQEWPEVIVDADEVERLERTVRYQERVITALYWIDLFLFAMFVCAVLWSAYGCESWKS